MKPDTSSAMLQLIGQIREAIPFDIPESTQCSDYCRICTRKLLEFLGSELEGWEVRLEQGEVPTFKDLSQLARAARKVHTALKKSGLVE